MTEEVVKIKVAGMHCGGCETVIETTVGALPCVREVHASFAEGTISIRYDSASCSLEKICQNLEPKGYQCILAKKKTGGRFPKLLLSLLGLLVLAGLIYAARHYGHALALPKLGPGASDLLVLTVGLITGFHCVGMCGGFVLSYTQAALESGRSPYLAHFFYGLGKTLSYTLFGALCGSLGALVSFTPFIRGMTAIIAGLFLIGFGLSMLGVIAWFRRLMIRQPKILEKTLAPVRRQTRHPFLIGFFTGFMFACGPLQAMYMMAAGSADPWEGAKIMFLFGIGTLPALLGFGLFASFLSARVMRNFFRLSGVLVITLGIIMVTKGMEKSHVLEYIQPLWQQMLETKHPESPSG